MSEHLKFMTSHMLLWIKNGVYFFIQMIWSQTFLDLQQLQVLDSWLGMTVYLPTRFILSYKKTPHYVGYVTLDKFLMLITWTSGMHLEILMKWLRSIGELMS